MAVNPANKLTISMYDQSGEPTSFVANRATPDDLSAGLPTALTAFLTAVDPYVDFNATTITKVSANAGRRVSNDKIGTGNREDKWLFNFQDDTTLAPYSVEIPLRTGGQILVPGTDFLAEGSVDAFRTEAEALFLSPDGNAGSLLTVQLIGRRS